MTDAELTILSLIAEGPRYGYEIQQIIDDRGLRDWLTIGFSSIYYILNKLERQNMLTSEYRSEGRGPARKIYQVTEAGRGILQTSVAELLRQPRLLGSGFELGLANLSALKPRQVYRVLSQHKTDLKSGLEAVEKGWQRQQEEKKEPAPDHIQALYTHSIAVMRAELEWLNGFLETWRGRYPGVEKDDGRSSGGDEAFNAITQIHRPTTPSDPAKMIQRLNRVPRSEDE